MSLKDPLVAKQTRELIYEVKLKEAMADVFRELIKAAAIENQLTGTVKLANEEKDPNYGVDHDVKLMSRDGATPASSQSAAPIAAGSAARAKMPPPAALSSEAAKQYERLNRPLKPGGGTTTTTNPSSGTNTKSTTTTTAAPSN